MINCIYVKRWNVKTHPCFYMNGDTVDRYILHKATDIITYSCTNFSQSMLVKTAPGSSLWFAISFSYKEWLSGLKKHYLLDTQYWHCIFHKSGWMKKSYIHIYIYMCVCRLIGCWLPIHYLNQCWLIITITHGMLWNCIFSQLICLYTCYQFSMMISAVVPSWSK